jgi:hypothetical protein
VGPITIFFGVVLILLGLVGYFATGAVSVTALIPAFFGLPLVVLGLLARMDHLRKHVMHAAVLIGLVGFLFPAIRAVPKVPTLVSSGRVVVTADGQERDLTFAVTLQLAMALVCGTFVALCVKSFIDARRSRARTEADKPLPS